MLPGVGGETEETDSPTALSKYDESEGVSVRVGVVADWLGGGIARSAARVDWAAVDTTPTFADALELTLVL